MRQRYSRARMESKRSVLNALAVGPVPRHDSGGIREGYDAKLRREIEDIPQVVDLLVELSGIEPLASSLRTRRSPS